MTFPVEELHEKGVLLKRLLDAHQVKRKTTRPPRSWTELARPNQLQPPGDDWSVWLIMAGRGWGKSRTGAEWLLTQIEKTPGSYAIVAPTWRDAQKAPVKAFVGALKNAGYEEGLDYTFNKGQLAFTFPNGSEVLGYSAEKPDRIRGDNLSGAWCDELAFFPKVEMLWKEALRPAVRIGTKPRILITTTPRAIPFLKTLVQRPNVKLVRGSTFENAANLSTDALAELITDYQGTRIGRQELYGELLDDAEHALWTRDLIDSATWNQPTPLLVRTIVAVDPSGSATGDATGIVTAGVDADGVIYVLADDTCKGSPEKRYETVCAAVSRWGAGTIVYEGAYGGDNIAHGLRSAWRHLINVGRLPQNPMPMLKVSPTKQSKADRAHPVVALYEQTAGGFNRIRHAVPLPQLEDEMVQWEPQASWSPNRIDALVHAARFLAGTVYNPTLITTYDALPALPALPIS